MDSRFVATTRKHLLKRSRELVRRTKGKKDQGDIWGELSPEDQRELTNVHLTLERIARGLFGQCSECSQTLSDNRLESEPTAELCSQCYESADQEALVA